MAKKRKTLRTRGAARRRRNGNLWFWGAVLVLAALGAVKAGSCAPAEGRSEAGAPGAAHWPDLELAKGAPAGSVEKEYEGFTLSFNPSNGTPDWVGWELLGTETDGPVSRSNKFHTDREVKGCPDTKDYSNSGYDRGHLCPAADQKWSSQAMSDCFYMTNMAPQAHSLNAGAWKTLEEKERLWARRDSAIVIVAGPIYSDSDRERIGEAGVRVPGAFFKVLLAPYLEEPRAIGFVYPNMRAPGNMRDYSMTVREVEQLTGLDFFSSLPDDLEERVETHASFNLWNK